MTEALLYEIKEQAAWLVINREARRNAITFEMVELFDKYLTMAETDDHVRTVVITGSGERAFCSGMDLGGQENNPKSGAEQAYANLLKRIAGFPKPTLARVNGHCLAGGTGFMLACDIVVSCDTARFGTPEVNVGLWPMMIGALIFRNAPAKKAMEMMMLGRTMDACQALDMGMLTRVVPPEQLDDEVSGILTELAEKSPVGIRIGKEAFYRMRDMPFEDALDYLAENLRKVARTEDAREGIQAFLEKRRPEFKGK